MTWLRTRWLPFVFLLFALPAGLGVVMLTPIGGVSDEPEHISRTDGLLTGQILGVSKPGRATAGVTMNAALFVATLETQVLNKPLPEAARAQARAVRWNDHRFGAGKIFCITQMVRYFPAFYIPGALGIAAGQMLRIPPLDTLFLGRFFMLLSFLSMGAAALHVARFGRPLLFTVLSLPMTLILAGSFNQDGQMIAAAALAAALLTRPRPGPNGAWLLALTLLTLIACAKSPYVWLLLGGLLPLERGGFGKRLGLAAAAAALPVLWLWTVRRASIWPWGRLPYHPGPLWPGSHATWLTATNARGNIAVLLAHPAQVFLLPLRSLTAQAAVLGHEMIGVLGWEAIPLPTWQYAGWLLALAGALVALALRGPVEKPRPARGPYLLVVLATVLSIALSAYVTFTNLGDTTIDGLRGRYFLPVLPFLLFILRFGPHWQNFLAIRRIASLPMAPRGLAAFWLPTLIMAAADIYALPVQIFRAFRMAGP